MIEIDTGSRIPIRRTFVFFAKRKRLYLSSELRFVDEVWFSDRFWPSKGSDITKYKPGSSTERPRPPSWKSIWRHIFAVGGPIWIKFSCLMQNNMPITVILSKSKLDVEFQYGGCLFKNRSSYISAVNWDRSTKVGLLIDVDLLKTATSTNTKPEIIFCCRGRHLKKFDMTSY